VELSGGSDVGSEGVQGNKSSIYSNDVLGDETSEETS
jgi:hypothetical protein